MTDHDTTTNLSDRIAKAIGVLYRDVMGEVRDEMARKDAEIARLRDSADSWEVVAKAQTDALDQARRELADLRAKAVVLPDDWREQARELYSDDGRDGVMMIEAWQRDARPAATEAHRVRCHTCGWEGSASDYTRVHVITNPGHAARGAVLLCPAASDDSRVFTVDDEDPHETVPRLRTQIGETLTWRAGIDVGEEVTAWWHDQEGTYADFYWWASHLGPLTEVPAASEEQTNA